MGSLEAQLFLASLEVQPSLEGQLFMGSLEVQLFLAPLEVQPSLEVQLFLAPLEAQPFLAPLEVQPSLEAQLFLAPLVPRPFLLQQLFLLPLLAKMAVDELKAKIGNSVYWHEYSIASINKYYQKK